MNKYLAHLLTLGPILLSWGLITFLIENLWLRSLSYVLLIIPAYYAGKFCKKLERN
jgi:hypothetical protein